MTTSWGRIREMHRRWRRPAALSRPVTPAPVAPAPAPSDQPAPAPAPEPQPDLRSQIAHLYRRAGFGATAAELDAAVAAGYRATVEGLLDWGTPDRAADSVTKPALTRAGSRDRRDPAVREQLVGERFGLGMWWLRRMAAAGFPLREKLALFWHDHFATSIDKVEWPDLMDRQQAILRQLGHGRFEPLLRAVAKDPAMMIWLDTRTSHQLHPNENFARELFELFSLGLGQYDERDVREAARAFTGWRFDHNGTFYVDAAAHDRGVKTVLGTTGILTGDDVIRLAANTPAAGRLLATKLWSWFARPAGPDDPIVSELAAGFARHGDIRALLRSVFLHPEFQTTATRTGAVRGPIEWLVAAHRATGVPIDDLALVTLDRLEQLPYRPPNVDGWPSHRAWLSTSSSLHRLAHTQHVALQADLSWLQAAAPQDRPRVLLRRLALDGWGRSTAAALAETTSPAEQLALALASPEFVTA